MKSYAKTLESYLIPAEEGLFSKIKEKAAARRQKMMAVAQTVQKQPAQPHDFGKSALVPISLSQIKTSYGKDYPKTIKAFEKVIAKIDSSDIIKEFDLEIAPASVKAFEKHLTQSFKSIMSLSETHAFVSTFNKEHYENDMKETPENRFFTEEHELYTLAATNWDYVGSRNMKADGTVYMTYDFDANLGQECFFMCDVYIELLFNKVVKKSLGSDYVGKCFADDISIYTVVEL